MCDDSMKFTLKQWNEKEDKMDEQSTDDGKNGSSNKGEGKVGESMRERSMDAEISGWRCTMGGCDFNDVDIKKVEEHIVGAHGVKTAPVAMTGQPAGGSGKEQNTPPGIWVCAVDGCDYADADTAKVEAHTTGVHGVNDPPMFAPEEAGSAAPKAGAGSSAGAGKKKGAAAAKLDAAAMMDGTEFDVDVFWDQQRERSKKAGLKGLDRIQFTRAMLEGKRAKRAKKSDAEVLEIFRSLRITDQWKEATPEEAIERYFKKYAGRDDKLRAAMTPERVKEFRQGLPQINPAQPGFSVDLNRKVAIKFDDVKDVRSSKEFAAMLMGDGFAFDPAKPAEDYIIFIDDENSDAVKIIAQVIQNQRAVDLIAGKPFLLDKYPINARPYSTQNVRSGKVLKLEGSICSFIKKLYALGVPLQQIMWLITEKLMALGMSPRSVYLDDEGAARRMVTVDSDDFGVRVEFYSEEDATMAMHLYDLALAFWKPWIHDGEHLDDALFKTTCVLKQFQIRRLQDTHPNWVLLKTGPGAGMLFKQLVEKKTGSASKASVAWYVEDYISRVAPHLELGVVEPETYQGGNVNFNLGVRVYYGPGDAQRKAMLALYAVFATRSEIHIATRLDYTRDEGEPFNDMRCEVFFSGRRIPAYKECGNKDESEKQNDLDKRGWLSDPINYFQAMRSKNWATSMHESNIKRQAALRAAGMEAPMPPIGSTAERLEQEEAMASDQEKLRKHLERVQGEALLKTKPLFPFYWRYDSPPTDVGMRKEHLDPMPAAVKWNDLLRKTSPELLLADEWEAMQTKLGEREMEQMEILFRSAFEKLDKKEAWIPSPAYNGIPIVPSTVPAPEDELVDADMRGVFDSDTWDKHPAVIYRVIARLISTGYIVQNRKESGLCLSPGPRMLKGNLEYDPKNPLAFLTGAGYDLGDVDAITFAKAFAAKVMERGVLWIPAGRFGEFVIPPYLAKSGASAEDRWSVHLRTHLEWEAGHFALIMQHVLSVNPFTQVVSPSTGGLYVLSPNEQKRRAAAKVLDRDYVPVSWEVRKENVGPQESRGDTPDRVSESGRKEPIASGEALDAEEIEALAAADKKREELEKRRREPLDFVFEDGFIDVHYDLTRGALLKLTHDADCPPEIARMLGDVASRLNPAKVTEEILVEIRSDETVNNTMVQGLAEICQDPELSEENKSAIAQLSSDLWRSKMVNKWIGEITAEAPPELHSRLARIPLAYASFFEHTQDSLRDILENDKLSDRLRTVFTDMVKDEKLCALVAAEKSIRADRGGAEPTEEDGGMIEDAAGEEGGMSEAWVPNSQETVSDEGASSQASSQPVPMTRPLAPDIITTVRMQLGTLSSTEGFTDLVEPFLELAREVEQVFPVQKTIEGILADPLQAGKIQAVVAQASITADLDMPVRLELAQIAVELYTFGRMHEEVLQRTADPKLPEAGRTMAAAMASQSQLAPSICTRIMVMAEEGNLTDGQRAAMRELAVHPSLQNEMTPAAGPAATPATARGKKQAKAAAAEAGAKPKKPISPEQVKEQGLALRKDVKKSKDTSAAKGGRPEMRGKKK